MSAAEQAAEPEMWIVPKGTISEVYQSLELGILYALEVLANHDAALGRTTRKNKLAAEAVERDIEQMRKALEALPNR